MRPAGEHAHLVAYTVPEERQKMHRHLTHRRCAVLLTGADLYVSIYPGITPVFCKFQPQLVINPQQTGPTELESDTADEQV